VLNVHPSLLPAFPGTDAPAQALAHGVKVAGCTVHLVTPELDGGPIVLQAAVPVLRDDSVASPGDPCDDGAIEIDEDVSTENQIPPGVLRQRVYRYPGGGFPGIKSVGVH
jgi:hypothetical protein